MASIFLDGMAHYATANILQKYTGGGGFAINSSPPAGRIGPALQINAGGLAAKTVIHWDSWIHGFAFLTQSNTGSGGILQWFHVGTSVLILEVEGDFTLSLYASSVSPGQLIYNSSSAGFSLHANTWYYIEVKFTLSAGTPCTITAELRVNGNVLGSGTKNEPFNTTDLLLQTATANNYIYRSVGLSPAYYKDAYVFNTQVISANFPNTDYAGDVTFQTVFPDGDVTTQWTPTGGGTSFDQVNNNPPNNGVTYIEDATPGDVDNFTWQDLSPFSGDIIAVQYLVLAEKTAEGTKSIKQTVGPTGSFEQLSPEWFLSDDYIYWYFDMDVDPGTTNQWTQAGFNAKDFGVEVIS